MPKAEAKPSKAGKTRDEFRALYDKDFIIPKKITDALAELGEGWLPEAEFMRLCGGMSTTDIATYRDQFEAHWFTVGGRNPKRIWCGTAALATELRQKAS